MPEVWWSDWCQRLSGHFGAEISHSTGADTAYSTYASLVDFSSSWLFNIGADTWVFLEIKAVRSVQDYSWHQMRLFTRWLPRTNQLLIVSFGASTHLRERITRILSRPDTNHVVGPFWVYNRLFTEAGRLEDEAVWKMRDLIREKEKERSPVGRPQPDYRYLHDVARHAIHVTETLDVIAETMSRVLAEYDAFIKSHLASQGGGSTTVTDKIVSENMRRRLCFLQHVIFSLKQRSVSNEKRLQNELQLAFNMVAQHDAYVSVQIGRAAQSDSAAAKTVAFVTLAFLPPTFVSAIFSMSFFTFDGESGWAVSDKFWIYWAFSVPITLISLLVWYWHENGSVAPDRQWWPRRAETIGFARASGQAELDPELQQTRSRARQTTRRGSRGVLSTRDYIDRK